MKCDDYAKCLLEREEHFPKSQGFVLGQRLAGRAMDLLVEASCARDKSDILATANRQMEVLLWTDGRWLDQEAWRWLRASQRRRRRVTRCFM